MKIQQHVLALPPGYLLGRYRLEGVLGSGGFGITYLAEDLSLGRKVAIKELLPNDFATRVDGTTVVAKTESERSNLAWARNRFVDEGRALAACDHPNVVHVYEMVEANNTAYMVTKYEEGCSLERWFQDLGRAPTEPELRGILTALLSGLERVHRAGFLHRDIKPENIYMTAEGRPVLLDFGSARQSIRSRSMVMTSIVSSGYAPFEQYHESGNQGAWSDIYALGAVMYRAITGSKPPESLRRLQNDPCEKLAATYAGRYTDRFLTAIDRSLNVNESQRPQSVADWCEMMVPGAVPIPPPISSPVPEPPSPLPQLERPPGKPFPRKVGAGAVALVLVVAGAWFFSRPKTIPFVDRESHQTADVGKQIVREQIVEKQSPGIDQAPPKTEPFPSEQQTPAHQSPSPSLVVAPQPSQHPPARAEESPQGKQFAIQPPSDGDQPPSTPALQPPRLQPNPLPVALNSPTPGPSVAVTAVDAKLVGSWQGRPNGSRGTWDRQWEQQADGTYTISGAVTESGTISASDGRIEKDMGGTMQPTEVRYKFGGNTLYTTDPDGTTTVWRLVRADSSNQKTDGPQTSGTPGRHTRHTGNSPTRSPSILREIRRFLPF